MTPADRLATLAALSLSIGAGCTSSASSIDAGGAADVPPDLAAVDTFVADRANADTATDVPRPDVVDPDVTDGSDAATARCEDGVPLPVMAPGGRAVQGLSVAASGDRHAVTWTVEGTSGMPAEPAQTWLAVLGADARVIGAPQRVATGSTVVSLTEGFGRVDAEGLTPLDADGRERGARVPVTLTTPRLERVGDRLYGLRRGGSPGSGSVVVSIAATGAGAVSETPLTVPADWRVLAFGPSRVLLVTVAMEFDRPLGFREVAVEGGAAVTRFDQRWSDGPSGVAGAALDEAAGDWIVAGGRRVPMTRQFTMHVWRVTSAGTLTARDAPGPSLYEGASGALSLGASGAFLALYNEPYNASAVRAAHGIAAGPLRVDDAFGMTYFTRPQAAWNARLAHHAVLYGTDARGTIRETALSVRCVRPR